MIDDLLTKTEKEIVSTLLSYSPTREAMLDYIKEQLIKQGFSFTYTLRKETKCQK